MIEVTRKELLKRAKSDMLRQADRLATLYPNGGYSHGEGGKCEILMQMNNLHMKIDWINNELAKEEREHD